MSYLVGCRDKHRMELVELLKLAYELVEPSEEERAKVRGVAERLVEAANKAFSSADGFRGTSLEGSAAKDTWIRGRAEIDLFVHFSPEIPKDVMEGAILRKGDETIRGLGGESRIRYADHPYIEGLVDGVTINIVGCYDVKVGEWLSPVDRTPHHTIYVNARLDERSRREVRLLKAFLSGIGCYGAEIRVGGFSGYLSELLTIHYRGFLNLVREAQSWRPPVIIDPEGQLERREALALFPDSCLIVIDPVDKRRNVASAVSKTKLSEFILASRVFLNRPSLSFFKVEQKKEVERLGINLLAKLQDRSILMLNFRVDRYIPPDVLWGELKRSARGIQKAIQSEGFKVYRHTIYAEDSNITLIYELEETTLPQTILREGPPVNIQNSLDFIDKHLNRDDTVAGPWVEDGRLYVIKRRNVTRVEDVLREKIARGEVAVSRDLKVYIREAEITTRTSDILDRFSTSNSRKAFLKSFLDGVPSYLSSI